MEIGEVQSSNINSLWLQNIYDNIKKIEEFERFAREGCASVVEYLQIPHDQRQQIIADVQYKNLKLLINELKLVIPDITPVVDSTKVDNFIKELDTYRENINQEHLFIRKTYSEVTKKIKQSSVTPLFYQTLENISSLRKELIELLQSILYIKAGTPTW